MKYRKKPVVIKAYKTDKELDIETLEGTMHASVGDYIITGVRGEKYPCKPDIFEQTYEPADASASPWHRVEEPPEPHKNVLVTGMEAINNSRVYKVMVNDNGTWRPTDYAPSIRWDYWMPIEPPKEEENGN